MIDDLDIIDGHVHCFLREHLDRLVADIRYTGAKRFCVLVTSRGDGSAQWDNALQLKQQFPDKVFLFGGLDFSESRQPFEQQLQELIDIGCDGLKLLLGKPDQRKAFGQPLDSPVLEPMLAVAQVSGRAIDLR